MNLSSGQIWLVYAHVEVMRKKLPNASMKLVDTSTLLMIPFYQAFLMLVKVKVSDFHTISFLNCHVMWIGTCLGFI